MFSFVKKHYLLILIQLICLLIVLPGCFAKEELVWFGTEEDFFIQVNEETQQTYRRSPQFSLRPGVYQVRASLEIPQNTSSYLNVQRDQGAYQDLKCNGMTVFPNQEYVDFEAYVSKEISEGYVLYQSIGSDTLPRGTIAIYRINWGNRMLVFSIVLISCIINAIVVFRGRIIKGEIKSDTQIVFWVLTGSVLMAYFPYATEYYSFGADSAFHMLRIEGLKETLLQGGQFPVRVQSYWMYDHGYAVSTFYGELFLLIPVFLRFVGFSLMDAYKMFVFSVMCATAGVSYYSFKKCTGNRYAALIGSVIYILAPYRIYNFYNRGAVGEYVAMVFLPLVFAGIYLLYTQNVDTKEYGRHKWLLIIGLSGILQSHLITCEMVAVFILAVCVIWLKRTRNRKTFTQLAQAAGITLLWNSWFWVPLLYMMSSDSYMLHQMVNEKVQYMGTYLAGIFQLYPNKGTAQSGMYMCEPIQIGIASWVFIGTFLFLRMKRRVTEGKTQKQNTYDSITGLLVSAVIITLFLSTRYFPWDLLIKIPGIRFFVTAMQFPTRMMSPATVLCSFVGAFGYLWLKEELGRKQDKSGYLKMICLTTVILAFAAALYQVNDIAYNSTPIYLHTAENMGTISVMNEEYILQETNTLSVSYHGPVSEEGLEWSNYTKKGTNISIHVTNQTDQEKYLELPLFGYLGYGLKYETYREIPYITEERGNHGDLRIAVPSGYEGVLQIQYEGFWFYRIAEAISALTLLGMLGIAICQRSTTWIKKKRNL